MKSFFLVVKGLTCLLFSGSHQSVDEPSRNGEGSIMYRGVLPKGEVMLRTFSCNFLRNFVEL